MSRCRSSYCKLNGCVFPQACPNDSASYPTNGVKRTEVRIVPPDRSSIHDMHARITPEMVRTVDAQRELLALDTEVQQNGAPAEKALMRAAAELRASGLECEGIVPIDPEDGPWRRLLATELESMVRELAHDRHTLAMRDAPTGGDK